MIAPLRRRFMFLPSKASALVRNSATSIWSSVALGGLYSFAIFDSVSPRFTVYVLARALLPGPQRVRAGAALARAGATGSAGAAIIVEPGGSSRNV